jgi:hypothetical protein
VRRRVGVHAELAAAGFAAAEMGALLASGAVAGAAPE